MATQLQVLSGKRQGFVLDIDGHEVVDVGNRKTAMLTIHDPWISWNHAKITLEGGKYYLEDTGSSNGTWVNGEKVKRRELRANDVIYFGKTKVKFAAAGGATAPAAPVPDAPPAAAPAGPGGDAQPWWDRVIDSGSGATGSEPGSRQLEAALRDERRMREALEKFLDVPRGTPLGDAGKAGQLEQRVRELERELAEARASAAPPAQAEPVVDHEAVEKLRREHTTKTVELESRVQAAEARAVDLDNRLKERSEQAKKEVARAREKLQGEIDELRKALDEARAAATGAAQGDAALQGARERGDRLEQELEQARTKALDAERRADDARQELSSYQASSISEAELDRLTKALEEARAEVEHWQEEHKRVVQEIDEISMEQIEIEDGLNRKVRELEARLGGAPSEEPAEA